MMSDSGLMHPFNEERFKCLQPDFSSSLIRFGKASILCYDAIQGDGGGGDGSSGSEESGNDGGVSTIPLQPPNIQTTYDVLRGLGIVGCSAVCEHEDSDLNNLPGNERNNLSRQSEVKKRQAHE